MDPAEFLCGGSTPIGSLTGGLLERLRHDGFRNRVSDHEGTSTSATDFAETVQQAATGLSRRGLRPDDVLAVLAPVSTDRLTGIYTAMAVGGIALPLELTSDIDTLAEVLVETDARMIMVSPELASLALVLSERSRVRQVVAFGSAEETTPFDELLRPTRSRSAYDPTHGLFNSGLLGYAALPGGRLRTVTHSYRDLMGHFRRLCTELNPTPTDVVAIENGMTEFDRCVLAAVALWRGASVVALAPGENAATGAELAHAEATIRGYPFPCRIH
ncbi:AMP-binding protein [Nocardiopsis ansamitocini]|uniref:AMP-dependent synthetase/ligase domain-containing protein n=1 Tax=Nocardiopsis ansamitocini TaxID=1670832 RepID=A0A9W6UG36_9ACTN|nr:AMP-binding protein [Nocardiopsis ansamitocini]GLU46486.1 hypothetical protein Nans01_08370 [Nocardiopsis ansamitocini]